METPRVGCAHIAVRFWRLQCGVRLPFPRHKLKDTASHGGGAKRGGGGGGGGEGRRRDVSLRQESHLSPLAEHSKKAIIAHVACLFVLKWVFNLFFIKNKNLKGYLTYFVQCV